MIYDVRILAKKFRGSHLYKIKRGPRCNARFIRRKVRKSSYGLLITIPGARLFYKRKISLQYYAVAASLRAKIP